MRLHPLRPSLRLVMVALGLALLAGALSSIDLRAMRGMARGLALALPIVLMLSGLGHLVRAWSWAWCLPDPGRIGFLRLARVRLAAEAYSYLTFGTLVGEPLKVVLLADSVDRTAATAAIALDRFAYLFGTTVMVGLGAVMAIVGLPLAPLWGRVFRAMAVGSAAVTLSMMLLVVWRDAACRLRRGRVEDSARPSRRGRVMRFVAAVEQQARDLVTGNPRRLLVLIAATVASFVLMVLEAYVILRAAGTPLTAIGAVATETLSRVATFASAMIPGNLGALEASSVAAAAAAGAAVGGGALALTRRVRGLFWAGVGLAVYPRRVASPTGAAGEPKPPSGSTLIYLPHSPYGTVAPSVRLAGLPIAERVLRAALRAGYARIIVCTPEALDGGAFGSGMRALVRSSGDRLITVNRRQEWDAAIASLDPAEGVTIIGAGTVVSTDLLAGARALSPEDGRTIDIAAGPAWPESGVIRMAAADARDPDHVTNELAARRPRGLPQPSGADVSHGRARLAIRIAHEAELDLAEQTIRRASYKDTDAKIARFNRRISLPISVALIPTPLTANQLSVILVAIGFYSAWLFSLGQYLAGALAAFLSLAASVMDGCDGEIARLKYQESALGCWIETVGDYSYYLAIFVGLTVGAVKQTHTEAFYWLGALALTGTLLSFALLIFLRARITGGRPEKLHAVARARFKSEPTFWTRLVWRVSFVATRAAMPYGIMGFALLGALPAVVVLAAIGANVYWISLAMKMRDLLGGGEAVAAA